MSERIVATVNLPLGPLDNTAFTAFGVPTTWGETFAFVTGALCVWLVARQNPLNWPIGIANSAFFLALFANYGLYADSSLQVVFISMGAFGWWAWLRGGVDHSPLPLSRTTSTQWIVLIVFVVAATTLLTLVLDHWTDSNVPFFDAFTTSLSLAATWGQTRKKVESWYIWILADLIYIPLYFYKDLVLTAILYSVFLTLCVIGLRNWTRDYEDDFATKPVTNLALAD